MSLVTLQSINELAANLELVVPALERSPAAHARVFLRIIRASREALDLASVLGGEIHGLELERRHRLFLGGALSLAPRNEISDDLAREALFADALASSGDARDRVVDVFTQPGLALARDRAIDAPIAQDVTGYDLGHKGPIVAKAKEVSYGI